MPRGGSQHEGPSATGADISSLPRRGGIQTCVPTNSRAAAAQSVTLATLCRLDAAAPRHLSARNGFCYNTRAPEWRNW